MIMKIIQMIIKVIDSISDWVGKISAFSVLILTGLVVMEVIMRRFLSSPTIWSFEMVLMVYGFLIMMVACYGLRHGSIVRVDVLSSKFSPRIQHILLALTYLIFFFPFITFMLPVALNFAQMSWAIRETSWSAWGPPMYYIKTVVPLSLGLLWLQGVSEFLKSIVFLINDFKKKPESLEGDNQELIADGEEVTT